ncbi:MAG: globin [Deinococcales bacterium]
MNLRDFLPQEQSLYSRISASNLRKIVEAFYPLVQAEPLLAELFPDNLSETMNKQEAFLTGFLGGPPLYHQIYGNPMLRYRHAKFAITPTRARAWFSCFQDAVRSVGLEPAVEQELLEAVAKTAAALVNTHEKT